MISFLKVAVDAETNVMAIGHAAAVVIQTLHGETSAIVVKSQNQKEVAQVVEVAAVIASDKAVEVAVVHHEVVTISDEIKDPCEEVIVAMIVIVHINLILIL